MALVVYLLLIFAGVACQVCDGSSLLIQWHGANCSEEQFTLTPGRYPRAGYMGHLADTSEGECRRRCAANTACGGFVVDTPEPGGAPPAGTQSCWLRNIDASILAHFLSDTWYYSSDQYRAYYKDCPYDLGATKLDCDDFTHQHDGQHVSTRWRLTFAYDLRGLPREECQKWCTLYAECRSVAYQYIAATASAYCHLYRATIGDLLRQGATGDVLSSAEYVTYDRYCDHMTPYVPDTEPPADDSHVECGCASAQASIRLNEEFLSRQEDVVVYVAGNAEQCYETYTWQEVAASRGQVNVTVDYRRCGADITAELIVLNTSVVAAFQHAHSQQMYSIYRVYCEVLAPHAHLNTSDDFLLGGGEPSVDDQILLSDTTIDSSLADDHLKFTVELLGGTSEIVANQPETLRITPSRPVPFSVYNCSMISKANSHIRVTLVDHSGCMSNGARANLTDAGLDINFTVKHMPYIARVYFACSVRACLTVTCPQNDCDAEHISSRRDSNHMIHHHRSNSADPLHAVNTRLYWLL